MKLYALLTAFLLLSQAAVAEENLNVAKATFAGGVLNKEPNPSYASNQTVAPGSLWFWTEIRVTKEAIAELRSRGLLPLQHRWYKTYGGMPGADEPPDFFRNLEEIDDRKMDALAGEADARGFFTYRTASCREALSTGNWVAAVTDVNGNTIPCVGRANCRFAVRVSSTGIKTQKKCLGD